MMMNEININIIIITIIITVLLYFQSKDRCFRFFVPCLVFIVAVFFELLFDESLLTTILLLLLLLPFDVACAPILYFFFLSKNEKPNSFRIANAGPFRNKRYIALAFWIVLLLSFLAGVNFPPK
jgi:hypothetical protein